MLTVPEVAKRVGCNPETVRRWIREGKLPAGKVGTQHVVDEKDLDAYLDGRVEVFALPKGWKPLPSGLTVEHIVATIREGRR